MAAKERSSYRLPGGFARSASDRMSVIPGRWASIEPESGGRGGRFPGPRSVPVGNGEKGCHYNEILGAPRTPHPERRARGLRAGPLMANALQFHRTVRDGDAEGGADGAFDKVDVTAVGADQLSGDGKAKA